MSDLKNCPFCGKKPKHGPTKKVFTDKGDEKFGYAIWCGSNPYTAHAMVKSDAFAKNPKEEAIESWNTRAQDVLNDRGPWSAKQEPVTMSFNDVWVESEDFKHAVRLYVYGNFDDRKQCFSYAENIAKYLNNYNGVSNQMREHVHRKMQLKAKDAEVKRLREALDAVEGLFIDGDRCDHKNALHIVREALKGGSDV